MRSIALVFASLATAFVQAAAAQEVPGRVGRLAYTQGSVSVYQDPEFGWDKAYVNTPITSENSVWTDRGARAEMRVGGIAVRLDGETQLDVSRLDEDLLDASVQRGTVNLRVRYKERNDQVTFATPHALFNIETDGRYRIDVDEDRDESRLTVFGGYAFLEGSAGRVPVEPGRTLIVSGGRYDFARAAESAFDRWAAVRDQQWQDSNSRRYVSYDMTGYEELDRYGTWSQDADYGAIWFPTRIAAGWAPYRDGHWTYVRPWGWTWVDDAPWGYAPSHYGRWVQVRDRWGWTPGAVRERPLWAPALVGFIGGAGFSVGISTGSPVGWYPLAPWERYDPWYRASPTYVTRVNRYVVDRAPRWYQGRGDEWRRWNRDRASTVVNRDVFVNRRAVQGSLLRMNPETLRQASAMPSAQVIQQVLPQRNEVLRFREQNRVNVAAPVVTRERRDWQQRTQQQQQQQGTQPQPQPQPQQQAGQVVRPEFHRRFGGAPPVAITPAPSAGQQPPVSAPAPEFQQQPQNPAARVERAQQRQAEDAARAAAQQQQLHQREAERAAERATRDRLQSDQNRAERAAQRQAEEAARAAAAQQNARDQQRAVEAQRQQQEQAQRGQQEQAQRAAREAQQQQERAARENQQQQQRQAREAQQAQERAQREAQQQQQRQAQERAQREAQQQQQQAADLQRKREEAAQRAARDTQAREQAFRQQQEAAQRAQQQQQQQQQRAQPQPVPPPPPQAQPQPQPQPQANPAARGDNRGRGREKDKEDKDKEEKDKKDKR